ncbi:MAG TPA: hypothetical protein VLM42_10800 [Bryobacteraceae bacterium]|nr:hypothetical protein [Bryobacteraceae bacterium]
MKTARAEFHLQAIEIEHQRLIDEGMYNISKKDNPKKFRHILRLDVKPMSPLIAMLAGEFAYCLRSGLDQLAWQLALLNVKRRPRSSTSFPIRGIKPPPPKGFGDAIKDILPAAFQVIESFQPYHRGAAYRGHPLWILNELCITDKHYMMPVNSTACRFTLDGASEFSERRFQHAVEIHVPLSDKFKVQLNAQQPEIILGEPSGDMSSGFEVRIAQLRPIHDFVRNDVTPAFAGFFK